MSSPPRTPAARHRVVHRRTGCGAYHLRLHPLSTVLAANARLYAALPGLRRAGNNVALWFFQPEARELIVAWDDEAPHVVAAVRAAIGPTVMLATRPSRRPLSASRKRSTKRANVDIGDRRPHEAASPRLADQMARMPFHLHGPRSRVPRPPRVGVCAATTTTAAAAYRPIHARGVSAIIQRSRAE